jgi:hypothetical protein
MRALALLLLASCTGSTTEIHLVVDADVEGAQAYRVVVDSPSGTSRTSTATFAQPEPRTLVLRHRGGTLGPIRVTIDALDAEGHALMSVVRELTFETGRTLTLNVFLAQACRTASCPIIETCGDLGECRTRVVDTCEYEGACLVEPADGGVDAGSCGLPEICGLVARYLPGDTIAPAPCGPAEATISVTGPSGEITADAGRFHLTIAGTYAVRMRGAGCTVEANVEVAAPLVIDSNRADVGNARDIAARIGAAFVAADWHDLIAVGSGELAPEDLESVALFDGDVWLGPHSDRNAVFRVQTAAPFDAAVHASVDLPDGSREVRAMAVRSDGTALLVATKDGPILIDGSVRQVGPPYDGSWAALGVRETVSVGAVWIGRRDEAINVSLSGRGELGEGSPMTVPGELRGALDAVIDDREAMLLWICGERRVALYDLAVASSLSSPIASWDVRCSDIAIDVDGGAWVAGGDRLVRLGPTGDEIARVEGISVHRLALARDAGAREVWMLDIGGERVSVLSADALP